MIRIYHNPRCSKSRQGLEILNNSKTEFEIIKYLDTPPTAAELKEIINKLNINPIDLVRKTEAVWKEQFKGIEMSDNEVIEAMVNNPKLIERPIVINGNKAVIGRPPTLILDLL